MATTAAMPVEDYLKARFEGVEPEYVHGELVERPMPNFLHAKATQRLAEAFAPLRQDGAAVGAIELRLQLGPANFRIPDYCVFLEDSDELYPSSPPLIVVEVVSPEDSYVQLVRKLEDYRSWGVRHIWLVDPHSRRFSLYDKTGLQTVPELSAPELNLTLAPADLFDSP